mmetsp:Transcript_25863/g.62294  ORF Transcript_25863/g.62294 Transcript_25863/m.62294 type:complete len:312 (+) Transcript_25863:1781-2716(+)
MMLPRLCKALAEVEERWLGVREVDDDVPHLRDAHRREPLVREQHHPLVPVADIYRRVRLVVGGGPRRRGHRGDRGRQGGCLQQVRRERTNLAGRAREHLEPGEDDIVHPGHRHREERLVVDIRTAVRQARLDARVDDPRESLLREPHPPHSADRLPKLHEPLHCGLELGFFHPRDLLILGFLLLGFLPLIVLVAIALVVFVALNLAPRERFQIRLAELVQLLVLQESNVGEGHRPDVKPLWHRGEECCVDTVPKLSDEVRVCDRRGARRRGSVHRSVRGTRGGTRRAAEMRSVRRLFFAPVGNRSRGFDDH